MSRGPGIGHVVLVGAGHANLALVRRARRLRRAGLAVTLVDPGAFWYPGMAAAMLGGAVGPDRDRIEAAPAALHRGVRFVAARATGIDPGSGQLTLDDGRTLTASAVVLNVGSDLDARGLPVERPEVVPAEPIAGLLDLHRRLLHGPVAPRVVVVGGGVTALEAAGNLSAGPVADVVAPRVTVVAGEDPLSVITDARLRQRLLAPLHARGVTWDVGPRAVDVTDDGVVLADGRVLPADHVLLATGLRASRSVQDLGLGDARGMPVTATLQHPEHPRLLGAGDAVRFGAAGLPRLGVFAVRQAPVLLDNLVALHTGAELQRFEPQERFVAAVDLGGGDAVLMRGRWWFGGRSALVAKRLLDEWYLRRHRAPAWSPAAARTVGHPRPGGAPVTTPSTPTAARWLVLDADGDVRAVDVVGELLDLDPRTKLRSRDGEVLRGLAAAVEQLVGAGAVCASGTPLLEVLVADAEEREKVTPSMDLEALLAGEEPVARTADRTIRLAGALTRRARAHRAGEVDLVRAVAPPGPGRHAVADEVERRVAEAVADVRLPADPSPAVVTLDAGWVGASPFELFVLAARGVPSGAVADTVGEGIARWFDGWVRGPDPWRQPLLDRVDVDADGLLHDAAARAGSEHPAVLGGVLTEQVSMRYTM